jgi:hypothetical protein
VKIEWSDAPSYCKGIQGRAALARNTNTKKTVRATIRATTDVPRQGYPREEVVALPAGGQQQIGCERTPDGASIRYQVVGEE